ncbi:hypothetical protein BH11PSE11_BH11PSE11_08430 [soil metagenome]
MVDESPDQLKLGPDSAGPGSAVAKPAKVARGSKSKGVARDSPPATTSKQRGPSLYRKLQHWLASANKSKGDPVTAFFPENDGVTLQPDLPAPPVTIGTELANYLAALQKRQHVLASDTRAPVLLRRAVVLRQVITQAPPASLSPTNEKSIELLARVFDFILCEQSIPTELRALLGRLQIPLLKVALIDRDFFFNAQHPARRLIEIIASIGLTRIYDQGRSDPLLALCEQSVDRIQLEFDQQLELFDSVVAELDCLIAEEACMLEHALLRPTAEALGQEQRQLARDTAENDVAERVGSGEVPGFVEHFLEHQWTTVLEAAYLNAGRDLQGAVHALKSMDDLIWSLKPKYSIEERKHLVARLPEILAMVRCEVNTLAWEESERVRFFSTLAERHAAIVRAPLDLTSRRQVELAVNVAQKASNRQIKGQAKKMKRRKLDQFMTLVDSIECNTFLAFVREDESRQQFRLAWISPQRSLFLFANRRGSDIFLMDCDDLAQAFRNHKAAILPMTSVIDCALATALDEIGGG